MRIIWTCVFDLFDNDRDDLRPCFCSHCTGEKGVAYTLLTSTDQNFLGDLVRNLVSIRVSFGILSSVFEGYRNFYI